MKKLLIAVLFIAACKKDKVEPINLRVNQDSTQITNTAKTFTINVDGHNVFTIINDTDTLLSGTYSKQVTMNKGETIQIKAVSVYTSTYVAGTQVITTHDTLTNTIKIYDGMYEVANHTCNNGDINLLTYTYN